MSKLMKVAIPLIDNSLCIKDLEDGFVDAYGNDINRPYLDNNIFLMYDCDEQNKKSLLHYYKFKDIKSYCGYKIIYISGKPKIVYCFTSTKKINNILDGIGFLSEADKIRILQFWNFTDAWISANVIRGTIRTEADASSVPEEDFDGDIEEMGERHGLVLPTH